VNDTAARLRQVLGVGRRELLTTADIARDYKFPSAEAARCFLKRHPQIPIEKRDRTVLVDRRELDRYLQRRDEKAQAR
jgi:hypothetical protein